MKHSVNLVTFIETSVNAAKLRQGKRAEYRLKEPPHGNVMEHLVPEVLPPLGKSERPRRVWRVHYDCQIDGRRVRRKIKIGDTNSTLSAIKGRWREIKSAVDEGRDWYFEKELRRKLEEAPPQRKPIRSETWRMIT